MRGWISVRDGEPIKCGMYLAVERLSVEPFIAERHQGWWGYPGASGEPKVTHWMRLPAPPEARK
ncbi:MAG: DUF551 domain-containing protein [Deltaproteobacteria bacterium]|nr:DUF551 domain-containing protein [Deltaproteobacteria bacterium]